MNLYDFPAFPQQEETTTILAESGNVRIERIVSTGHTTGWYDQDETEFIALLEGSAVITYEDDRTVALAKGDTLLIRPHQRHRVSYTSSEPPCVWLCVFEKNKPAEKYG